MSFRRQHIRNTRAVLEAGTPLIGEYPYDTDLKTIRAGDGATLGGLLLKLWGKSYVLSPAQIAANQNDYNPADLKIAETLLLDLSANWTITGLAGAGSNREISIYNTSAFRLTLSNENIASTAGNRFHFGTDVVLRPYQGLRLIYSSALARWIALGRMDLGVTDLPENITLSGAVTPAAITADQNNYNPAGLATASRLRLSTDAARAITGIAGGGNGRILFVINSGVNPLTLKDASALSAAANRFDFGADVTLSARQAAVLQYDDADSRWKMLANTAGAAVADNATTARTLAASAIAHGPMVNGYLVWSVAGNALTITVKTLLGNDPSAADPVYIWVRSASAGDGAMTRMALTAALSFTVSSGSSLGVVGTTPFRLWAVLFNDGGTPRLALINCRGGGNQVLFLGQTPIASATTEGGAGGADVAMAFYSEVSFAAKPYAVLGFGTWETGLAAAGIWSAGPTNVQLFGPGIALPGTVIQSKDNVTNTWSNTTAQIPNDDTIPQNTEGALLLSTIFTPASAANVLDLVADVDATVNPASRLIAALFQDASPDAIAVGRNFQNFATGEAPVSLSCRVTAGTANAITFNLRAGSGTPSTTIYFNGNTGTRVFGGALRTHVKVTEIQG